MLVKGLATAWECFRDPTAKKLILGSIKGMYGNACTQSGFCSYSWLAPIKNDKPTMLSQLCAVALSNAALVVTADTEE